MKNRWLKSLASLVLVCLLFLLFHLAAPVANAKETWTSVRSKNFLLIGNASDKEIRQVATRLEQFRDAFGLLFANAQITSPVPTTVIVFKSHDSYKPFKPHSYTAGYFQAGDDVNYITLTTERVANADDPFQTIFHEYVHLLVNNTLGSVPVWFNEGLAEYYSTFNISEDRKVVLGRVEPSHVLFLRQQKLLPLGTLFAVDHSSPYYNEKDKANVFYAESWALVHYLVLGNNGKRNRQMGQFLNLLNAGKSIDAAFKEAFQTTYELLEKELREYIRGDSYPQQIATFKNKLAAELEMQSAPISEAEAQAYLGDLLLHSRRTDTEGYLQKALALEPQLGMANASMGMLRAQQGRFEEARQFLEKAVAANSQNYLAHYYYASAMSRQGMDGNNIVYSYAPETMERMRRELNKAIELAPQFAESYHLLAFINLVANDRLDESIVLLKKALQLSPGKPEYIFMLGQIYLNKQEFKLARQLLTPLANESSEAEIRSRARAFLDHATAAEAQEERWKKEQAEPAQTGEKTGSGQGDNLELDPLAYLDEALRKPAAGEVRAQGTLVRIDCGPKWIVFTIKTADRDLKVQTDALEKISFSTFTESVSGEVTCGLRKNPERVIVIYKPIREPRAKVEGTAISMEFVPKEFKLKT